MAYLTEENGLDQKWSAVLDHPNMPKIVDKHRRAITTIMLENQEKAMREDGFVINETVPANAVGSYGNTDGVAKWDPVLISLVRRSMPQLIAYDICGVQPMQMPTGLIFAMKSKYSAQGGTEALFNEANSGFSGNNLIQIGNSPADPAALGTTSAAITAGLTSLTLSTAYASSLNGAILFNASGTPFAKVYSHTAGNTAVTITGLDGTGGAAIAVSDANSAGIFAYSYGTAVSTATGEDFGGGTNFQQMAFSIEKTSVTAQTRALKAEYTLELAQDLKAVHGLEAESELSNILSQEVLAEINREVLRTIYLTALPGARAGVVTTAGTFDLDIDSNGRWSAEKFKGLIFQIERDANDIAQTTRRGRGNFMVCSSDVASALAMTGKLDYAPALATNGSLTVDEANSTFAGVLNNGIKVYVDPYSANAGAASQFYVLGYKGNTPYDAGIFYCPYVPLQMVRATDPLTFQPKIGFKTRYGMVANPFATGSNTIVTTGVGNANANVYFRKVKVLNLS